MASPLSGGRFDGRIDEAAWQEACRFDDFARLDGRPPHARTTLWLGHDERFLYVAVRCAEQNTAALAERGHPASPVLSHRDHVELNFDTAHDHVGIQQLVFGPFEQFEQRSGTSTISHRAGPDARWVHWNITDGVPSHCHCRFATHIEEGVCWSLQVAIPFETLAPNAPSPPERGTVWGFNMARYTSWPVYQGGGAGGGWLAPSSVPCERTALVASHSYAHRLPVAFADLVFDSDATQLRAFDVGVPHFGENRSTLRFHVPDSSSAMVVASRVRALTRGELIDAEREAPVQQDGDGCVSAQIDWHVRHYDNGNRLEIELKRAADGVVEWRGSYVLRTEEPGAKQGGAMPLRYLHRGEHPTPPVDPDPTDPDFLRKKAVFIAAGQPRFERRTTAQGAPSDFTLQSVDGQTRFNLMEEGVTAQMARYIHSLYSTDADRLLGMSFFVNQPALTRANPAYDIQAIGRLDPLSQLRFGSGYCGHVAGVLAHLLNEMHVGQTDARHKVYRMGIGGHAICFVAYRDDYAILDPQNCWLFFKLDNTDLATLAEVHQTPAIVRRAFSRYLPALMTFDERFLPVSDPAEPPAGTIQYPAGAPVR